MGGRVDRPPNFNGGNIYIVTSKTRRTASYKQGALKSGDFYGRCAETMERDFARMEAKGELKGAELMAAKKSLETQKVIDENVKRGLVPSGKMSQIEYDQRNEIFCEEDGTVGTTAAGVLKNHEWEVVGDAPSEEVEIESGYKLK